MLKIVIPIAGSSKMFQKAGYQYPKPLVEINGQPMIEWVINGVKSLKCANKIVFIIKEEDALKFHLDNTLTLLDPECEIVRVKNMTKGGLCSTLMAIDKVDKEDSLLILNGDQIIDEDLSVIHDFWIKNGSDLGVVTFTSVHPRWSYILTNGPSIVQTAEKNPISSCAIAGYYYFKSAEVFFDCAFKTIMNDVQTDGMFFISPVINEFILNNCKTSFYRIINSKYHSFYTPKLIDEFELKNSDNGKV